MVKRNKETNKNEKQHDQKKRAPRDQMVNGYVKSSYYL